MFFYFQKSHRTKCFKKVIVTPQNLRCYKNSSDIAYAFSYLAALELVNYGTILKSGDFPKPESSHPAGEM